MATIFEERNQQEGNLNWRDYVTEEQEARGSYYSNQYYLRKAEIDQNYQHEWDDLQAMYECRRQPHPTDPDYPNNFIPLLTPTVEGQIASMMESQIDFRHISNNPGHDEYMRKLDAASEYYRKKTNFNLRIKDFARMYDLLGNAWCTVMYEKNRGTSKSRPNGNPKIEVLSPLSVLVAGNIKDVKDIQYAPYIIHTIGFQSISWARKEFGDEKADALLGGYNDYEGNEPDLSVDDTKTFTLIHVWTRDNDYGNLQLIQMDAEGFILSESDPKKPYYKYVDNEYPFFCVRMIPQIGKFYGIGDGALLKPMQKAVNKLTDELELACRFAAQSRTYVDPAARMEGDQITSNPADIIWADNPRENILETRGVGINNVVLEMIRYLLDQAQKATRFHNIMSGHQQGTSATATQITSQINQGSVGIKDKKTDIAEAMAWADMYALKVAIEKWDKPFWASVSEDYSQYIYPTDLQNVPATVPASSDNIQQELDRARKEPGYKPSIWETTTDEKGNTIVGQVDFETKVLIGESIPKGRVDMYNILLGLAQINLVDDEGNTEPLVSPDRLRQLMEDILGMKLKTEQEEAGQPTQHFAPDSITQQNPVGAGDSVQRPQSTPENLQQTVAQMPDRDSRRGVL